MDQLTLDKIIEMTKNGVSRQEIAAQHNLKPDQVRHIQRTHGLTKKRGKKPTTQEIDQIKIMRDQNFTLSQISKQLNLTIGVISGIIRKFDFPKKITFLKQAEHEEFVKNQYVRDVDTRIRGASRAWTDDEINHLRKLKSEDLSNEKIASFLGRSLNSVRNKLLMLGIYKNIPDRWSDEETALLECLLRDGKTIYDIGAVIDKDIFVIQRKADYMGYALSIDVSNAQAVNLDDVLHIKHKHSRVSAAARDIIFTITEADLLDKYNKQKGKCFYTGLYLNLTNGPHKISIDRMDSSGGYEKDNIVLCCVIVNIMKSDFHVQDFLSICKSITENNQFKLSI